MDLQFIFDELCKGNLSVLTVEAYTYIAEETTKILDKGGPIYLSGDIKKKIKLLCMIGNITYNRTDLTVLPIVDEAYDRLINLYKLLDKNFQVGSVVVDFKMQAETIMKAKGEVIIDPLKFKQYEERDSVREYYADRIMSFDKGIRFTHDEVFNKKSISWDKGEISKRLHDTKHNHPQLVGTLDKAKFVLDADAQELDLYDDPSITILERDFFWKHIRDGVITEDQQLQMVLELKYDGVSVEADCTDIVVSARTRGDTGIGEASDITPILYGYQFPRNNILNHKEVGVKFEAIIKYTDLVALNKERGTGYVNARTAIVGITNSSDGYKYRDFITLIPLAIDRDDVPEIKDRMEEIELLNSLFRSKGEPLRYCYIQGNYQACLFLIKKFLEEARYAREYLNFMFDGIVVSYLDEDIRNKLGRENFVNKYSIAVKFDPLSVLTTFLGYTFNVGQSGNICPMIHYSPVEFIGTVHDKSTGSSVKRFNDLALKPGDIIEVTYNNDVMPYVRKVDNEHNRQNSNQPVEFPVVCPCCGTPLVFSNTGSSAKCPNWSCSDRVVARLSATLAKLGITGFAEESVKALRNYQIKNGTRLDNLYDLFVIKKDILTSVLGQVDGECLYKQIELLTNTLMYDYVYFGALGFSDMGKATWKKIFKVVDPREIDVTIYNATEGYLSDEDEEKYHQLMDKILHIKGIGQSVVDTIKTEWPLFNLDIRSFLFFYFCNPVMSHDLTESNQKIIRFTGCRNQKLEALLCELGHDADGKATVTKETDILIIPYTGFHSTKTEKLSTEASMVPIEDFIMGFDNYIECEGLDESMILQTLDDIAKDLGIKYEGFQNHM